MRTCFAKAVAISSRIQNHSSVIPGVLQPIAIVYFLDCFRANF